jgi:hypothetical protein
MFKTFKSYLWRIIIFAFKCPFLTSNIIIPSKILITMLKGKTWVENFEIHVYTTFWQFWFKHAFDPKNYEM